MPNRRIASRAAVAASERAQSVGNDHVSLCGVCGFGVARASAAAVPSATPRDLGQLVLESTASAVPHQRTSAIESGGECRYVIDGDRPTVSVAISSASRKLDAAR